MFCASCGAEIIQNAIFCQNCGAKCSVYVNNNSNFENNSYNNNTGYNPNPNYNAYADSNNAIPVENKSKTGVASNLFKWIGIIVVVLFIIGVFSSISDNLNSLGISSSYLYEYSAKTTIGDAFDNFFLNPSWSNYEQGGYNYVKFTGVCLYMDEQSQATILFKMYPDDSFEIYSIKIGIFNWESSNFLSRAFIQGFIEVVYSGG